MIGRQEQPKLEKGDIIDYDNRRWHVDSVYSDGSIQLTNLNPLDGTINMSSPNWKNHIKNYSLVDKRDVDMSTLVPKNT